MPEFNGDFKTRQTDTITATEWKKYRDLERKRLFPDEEEDENG